MGLFLRRPTDHAIQEQLAAQANIPFGYASPGCTREEKAGAGFNLDRYRCVLGRGAGTFEKAKRALMNFDMVNFGWVNLVRGSGSFREGASIAMVVRAWGLTFVNMARVLYLLDDRSAGLQHFGFAYGTLTDHVERGEERFRVSWDRATDEVSYDILAVSRPRKFYVWLAYPYVRALQRRFGRQSLASMQRAVS